MTEEEATYPLSVSERGSDCEGWGENWSMPAWMVSRTREFRSAMSSSSTTTKVEWGSGRESRGESGMTSQSFRGTQERIQQVAGMATTPMAMLERQISERL